MNNFGIYDEHVKVPPQPFGQCSHHSHRNYNHHHNSHNVPSCCVPPASCCKRDPPQCCRPASPCQSSRSFDVPCPRCSPTTCPCHTSTQGSTAGQGYYWRDYYPGEIPHDAVAGIEGRYVGQVNHNRMVLPATIYAQNGRAVAESSGKQTFMKHIKILCSVDTSNIYWEHINFYQVTNEQMKYAIKGGYQNGHDLYIGVAYYEGEWRIGKVIPKEFSLEKGLRICNNFGNGIIIAEFHILKYKSPNIRQPVFVRHDFYWRDYVADDIPHDAVKGANDLYIGQVYYNSCNLPATIYPYHNVAITETSGKQIIRNNIKILCSPDPSKFYWEKTTAFENNGLYGVNLQNQRCFSFGTATKQGSIINTFSQSSGGVLFGSPPNQTLRGSGTHSGSMLFGAPQSQTSSGFGTQSNTHSGSVPFGAPPSQTYSVGTQSNNNSGSGLFGVQSNEVSSDSGPQSKPADIFGSQQKDLIAGCNGAESSFTFGIPQDMTKNNDKQGIQGGTLFGGAQNLEPVPSAPSQSITNTFGSSQVQGVTGFGYTQNPNVILPVQGQVGSINGNIQTQGSVASVCGLNSSVTFGSPQTQTTNNTGGIQNLPTGLGSSQAQQGALFGCTQNQSGNMQPQGTNSLFGCSQTQGFGGRGGLAYNQRNSFGYNPCQNIFYQQELPNLVKGGYQDGLDLYIGRTCHGGEWKIGKVVARGLNKVLHVWGRFNECIVLNDFEILKYRSS